MSMKAEPGRYNHHVLASNQQKRVEPFLSQCDDQGEGIAVKRPGPTIARFIGNSDDNGMSDILTEVQTTNKPDSKHKHVCDLDIT
jgi:hypothetical protein